MFTTIIIFIIVLSILVFVHEVGHFWTARRFGIKVEEFGFGLPPRIFGFKFKETIYSLNWIPVGGFVKIKGENGEAKEEKDSFASRSVWKRAVILAAGVLMNFILCVVFLSIGFGIGMPTAIDDFSQGAIISNRSIQIMEVLDKTGAKEAGLRPGDYLVSVDSQRFVEFEKMRDYLADKKDKIVDLKIKRGGEEIAKQVKISEFEGTVGLGVALAETAIVRYPWHLAVWEGMKATWFWLLMIGAAFVALIRNLFIQAPVPIEISGPVGIAVMTGQAAKLGFIYVLQFTALLSLNLAIINILPFPALDGGRILFLIIEKLRGRAVKQQWENLAHNIGFALLMLLVVLITYRDLARYGGRIFGGLKGLVGL